MFDSKTDDLLAKSIPKLPRLVMERSLAKDIDDLVSEIFLPMKLAVVDDANTSLAYGEQVFQALRSHFPTVHITQPWPQVTMQAVEFLRRHSLSCDAIIAVGSGTVNDLCKYVAALDRKAYLVFPTAASMNGYLSANASITLDGYKKTLSAAMPQAVFCDMGIIANAPNRLNQSGFGDALARPTAQADWLLSHLLRDTHYNEVPFQLLRPLEPELFDHARGIGLGDPASIGLLMKTLLLSGLGMTIAGGSYPASQGEHMIAHAMEMMKPAPKRAGSAARPPALHGEGVAVATLSMARLQERLLHAPLKLRPDDFDATQITKLYGEEITKEAHGVFSKKYYQREVMDKLVSAADRWEEIADKISDVLFPANYLEGLLIAAGAPTVPEDIGWTPRRYDNAISTARYLRDRFTFLDLTA